MDYVQIITTTPSRRNAEEIANKVITKKLAGCAQVAGPIKSIFWWKGKITRANEYICIIKSSKKYYKEIERTIKDTHKYEVPEILAIQISDGNKDYLRWLGESLMQS